MVLSAIRNSYIPLDIDDRMVGARARGTLGGGGHDVELETVNGSIRIEQSAGRSNEASRGETVLGRAGAHPRSWEFEAPVGVGVVM